MYVLDFLRDLQLLVDGLDDTGGGLPPVGLHHGQTQRSDPTDGVTRLGDELRALLEPLLDLVGAREEVGDGLKRLLGEVNTDLVHLAFVLEKLLVGDLAINLLAGADEGDPVDCLLYTSPSPRDLSTSRMPSSA